MSNEINGVLIKLINFSLTLLVPLRIFGIANPAVASDWAGQLLSAAGLVDIRCLGGPEGGAIGFVAGRAPLNY